MTEATARLRLTAKDDTAKAARSVQRRLEKIDKMVGRLRRGVAAAAVAKGLTSLARQTLDAADAIEKLSRRSGASAEFLSEMRFSLSQNDVSTKEFSNSLIKLNKSTADAAAGLSTPRRAFDELGISVDKFQKLNTDQKFIVLSEAISKVEDPAMRNQIAMDLMGRSGSQLLTVMENGAQGIEEYRKQAVEMGLSLSEDQVKGAAAANDALDRLSSSISGSVTQVLIKYTGNIERAADFTREYLPQAIEFLINIFRGLKVVVQGAAIAILTSFEKILGAASKIPGIGKKFKGAQLEVAEMADVVTLQMEETISAMSGLNKTTDENKKAAELAANINNKYKTTLESVAGSTGKASKKTRELTKEVEELNAVQRVENQLKDYRQGVVDTQQEVAELNRLYQEGKTTIEEHLALLGNAYPDAVRNLESDIDALFSDNDLWGFPTEAAKDAEKEWSGSAENIAGAWEGFVNDTIESGGTAAWENIKDKAFDVIKEIALKWASSKIFGGSFDLGGAISQYFGGGGNGGGINIGSLVSGGKAIASYLGGGGGASTAYTAANFIGAEGTALAGGQSSAVFGGNLSSGGTSSLGAYGNAAAGALVAAGWLATFDSIQGARTPAQIARFQANQLQGGVRDSNNPDDIGDTGIYSLRGSNGGNREIGDTLTILQGFLDGSSGGREGFFTGAGVRGQGSIGELAQSRGLRVEDHGEGIKVFAESQAELNELMAIYDERVSRAKLSTDDWLQLIDSGSISARNSITQNVLQVIGGTEKSAQEAIVQMDELFDNYVANGVGAHDAVYQSLSEKMGLSIDQVKQFVDRSGHDVDTWAAYFDSASGDALGSIEDFVKASGGKIDELTDGVSKFAGTFADEIDGAVRRANRSLSTVDTSLEGAVDINPGGDPFLGNFNDGGSFIVPGSGNTDKRFSIGLRPGERVTVDPDGGDTPVSVEQASGDGDLKNQLSALLGTVESLVNELEYQRANT